MSARLTMPTVDALARLVALASNAPSPQRLGGAALREARRRQRTAQQTLYSLGLGHDGKPFVKAVAS